MADRPIALVTGASSGIGAAIARRFAERDHDLVVVARDVTRLEKLAADLPGTDIEILGADLSQPDELAVVEERLRAADHPIDKLINNAGYGTAGKFIELDVDREIGMIDLNITALVRLTHAAAGGMVDRGRGGILNIGSVGSFQPSPYNAAYSATKAFVLSFTEGLHVDLKGTGVTATALCPGPTKTEFGEAAGIKEELFEIPGLVYTAEAMAVAGVQAMEKGRRVVIPGAPNLVTAVGGRLMPRSLVLPLIDRFYPVGK